MTIKPYLEDEILKIRHNSTAGFFSNCSIRLSEIVKFSNEKEKLPQIIDSSAQFRNYKERVNDRKQDLAKYFFDQKPTPTNIEKINFSNFNQYNLYKNIHFKNATPLVEAFFSPSIVITTIVKTLEKKYSINYENTCAVYYRGNDKAIETGLAEYKEFFDKAEEIIQKTPHIKFLIQTDEIEFAEEFKQKFSNSFWFDELSMINRDPTSSIHHSIPRNERKEHASYFFAAVLIMSKVKHLITYSGNCGFWTVLYRGNSENVHQYLKTKNWKTNKIKKDFGWIS
jgi:hypothetical protein